MLTRAKCTRQTRRSYKLRAMHVRPSRHCAAPAQAVRTRARAHHEERVDARRRLAECADDEPAHGPELAQALEDGAVAGATWHAATGGVDVARVPLVLAGDHARARFDGRAARRVDAVGVGAACAVDVGRLGIVVRVVAGSELHARVGRDRVLRRLVSEARRTRGAVRAGCGMTMKTSVGS